jgi:mRNA interferase MazF
MLCCPLTTQIKGYPFEVTLQVAPAAAVLTDQVKSLDWLERKACYKAKVTSAELASVRARIVALVNG